MKSESNRNQSLLGEYVSKRLGAIELEAELTRLVGEYNKLKSSYLFIYAADVSKGGTVQPTELSLSMSDYHIIHEMLRKNASRSLDFYIETPGGSGEAAEEIVEFFHSKFENLDLVIAGEAKSAGTLMAMSADDIFMTESGSLGPIDRKLKLVGHSSRHLITLSGLKIKGWKPKKRSN